MQITSLARQTDLFFSRFEGQVLDRGHYVAVKTPTNPGYHWGNYLIFSAPPVPGDFEKWKAIYRSEFTYYNVIKHMTFAWNQSPSQPALEPFLKAGFQLDRAKVLTATQTTPPPKLNSSIEIRTLQTPEEWEQAIQLQILCRQSVFEKADYENFKRKQFKNYQAMSAAGLGNWFGAFHESLMLGDLGVYHQDGLGRFQNVSTHPDYRRQGICGTLVHRAAQYAYKNYGTHTLVMEADADYHAAKIYESVGFLATEENQSLSWWEA